MISIFTLCLFVNNTDAQTKKVMIENLSGTWCGFCPDAAVILEELESYDNVMSVTIHVNDVMEIPEGAGLADEHTGGGVPAFFIDRKIYPNTDFISYGLERDNIIESLLLQLEEKPICDVNFSSFNYDSEDNIVSVELEAEFFENYQGNNLRFNLYLMNKEISEDDSDYYQANFYNFMEGHDYQNAGNPIKNYVHKDVLVKMYGGTWGTANSVRNGLISRGEKLKFVYSFPLDVSIDLSNLEFIGLIQKYGQTSNDIEILNSNKISFEQGLNEVATSSDPVGLTLNNIEFFNAFPNPVSDVVNIAFRSHENQNIKISIFNHVGKSVLSIDRAVRIGDFQESLNVSEKLKSGIYILKVENEQGAFISEKIVVD